MDRTVPFCDLVAVLLLLVYLTSAQRQCPKLQKPWNGQFVGTCNRYIGAECQFECREPYRLVGSRVRLCRSDGTWSGRTAACGPYTNEELNGCNNCGCKNCPGDSTCPSIYGPDHGYTEGQCAPGVVSQSCFFRCDSGYVVEGQSRITCLSNGQWSGLQPYCRMTSGALCEEFDIPNGDVDCILDGGLTICRVSCNAGFMLMGSSVITCSSSGSWNEQFPVCHRGVDVDEICQTLVAPEGGRLVGSCTSANPGDTCQLVCISGYRPTDTRVLVCQTDGRWSSSLPSCICGCPSVQVPYGTTSGTCNPGAAGQSCTVTCQAGYILSGSGTLICQTSGQWSSNVPSCNAAAVCPSLGPPTNGGTSGTCRQAPVGQSCTFSCQAGYTLTGPGTLYCQAGGQWSSPAPSCTRSAPTSCASLVSPSHGFMLGTCSPGRVGETCVFTCDDDYILRGQRTLTCQSGGQWTGGQPQCERIEVEDDLCPILTPPPHSAYEECDNRVGGRCIIVCENGYVRTGSRVRTCLSGGMWSGYAPTCTRKDCCG